MNAIARDIMTRPVISVKKEATIKDVAELLASCDFSGVPVVDQDDQVIGVLSETDIVKYSNQVNVIPFTSLTGWISPYTEINDIATIRKGIDLISRTRVEQVMSKKVFTLPEEASISEVIQAIIKRNINRVPIVDNQKRLTGIITRGDIMKYVAENH